MDSKEGSRAHDVRGPDSVTTEEAKLDEALLGMDSHLVQSLQAEDLKRRRRRWFGGIAMIGILIVLAGVYFAGGGASDDGGAVTLAQEGWSLWKAGNFPAATEKFRSALKADGDSVNAWNGLGWSLFNRGVTEEASEAFKECLRRESEHPAALNGLGQISFVRREYGEAKAFLLQAAKREATAAWAGLTKIYLLEGAWDEATQWGEKLRAQTPNDRLLKRMLKAAADRELSAELRREIEPPQQTAVDVRKGWSFLNAGDVQRAVESFESALKKKPDDADALNGLGFANLSRGKYSQAKDAFEKALRVAPKAGGALNGLARCLKAEGKVEEAIALWKELDASQKHANAGTSGLAYTYFERKEFAKAIPYLEKLIETTPQDKRAHAALKAAAESLEEKVEEAR